MNGNQVAKCLHGSAPDAGALFSVTIVSIGIQQLYIGDETLIDVRYKLQGR